MKKIEVLDATYGRSGHGLPVIVIWSWRTLLDLEKGDIQGFSNEEQVQNYAAANRKVKK